MVEAVLGAPLSHLVRRAWARVVAPADNRHCKAEPLCPACSESLYRGLNHVLDLASRLPHDVHGNTVRRSVCELIEASTGERHHKLRRLFTIISSGPHEIRHALQVLKRQGIL